MERKKLELKPNEKIILELLFDNPIEGESQYGKYFMYGVKNGNEEYNFFAPLKVHEALKDKPRGTKFQITKTAVQKGRKLVQDYEIKFSNNNQKVAPENGNSDSELFSARPRLACRIKIRPKPQRRRAIPLAIWMALK